MRPIIVGSLIVAAATSISCVEDKPTEEEYDDVAQAIGSTTATSNGGGETGSFADSAKLAVGQMPAGLSLAGNGHVLGQHLGLDYDYQITCKDAGGALLALCGPTTDSASLKLSWSGDLDTPNLSASVDRTGDWTLSGLQSGGATFNGEGTLTFDVSVTSIFRPVTRTYHLDYAASYDAVKIDASRHAVGGSIHYEISAEHTVMGRAANSDRKLDLSADVVFNADGSASVTLDGTHSYKLDLETGAVARM